jgi:hypothetical protein
MNIIICLYVHEHDAKSEVSFSMSNGLRIQIYNQLLQIIFKNYLIGSKGFSHKIEMGYRWYE